MKEDYEHKDDIELDFLYEKKFGEFFPSMCFSGDTRKMIIACLESGKPYKPNVPEGAVI